MGWPQKFSEGLWAIRKCWKDEKVPVMEAEGHRHWHFWVGRELLGLHTPGRVRGWFQCLWEPYPPLSGDLRFLTSSESISSRWRHQRCLTGGGVRRKRSMHSEKGQWRKRFVGNPCLAVVLLFSFPTLLLSWAVCPWGVCFVKEPPATRWHTDRRDCYTLLLRFFSEDKLPICFLNKRNVIYFNVPF